MRRRAPPPRRRRPPTRTPRPRIAARETSSPSSRSWSPSTRCPRRPPPARPHPSRPASRRPAAPSLPPSPPRAGPRGAEMRSNERMIFVGVAIVALVAAFYLLVLGPKRDKASELGSQIDQLNASISASEGQASYGEQARQEFPKYYGRMVVLGKAVPSEADTASLLVQLNSIAQRSRTEFRAIALNQG